MKEYNLKITNTAPTDWSEVERANIDSYVWGGAERAYATYGQLSYAKTGDENSGLYIHLFCEEKNPVSIENQLDGKVYEDSCMEFFFTMRDISAGDIGYIKWVDAVPGIQYSLSMTEGADEKLLVHVV